MKTTSLRKLVSSTAVALTALTLSAPAISAEWGYTGEGSPENWAKNPSFAACAGKYQTPIDIDPKSVVSVKKQPLQTKYKAGTTEIINNGHAVQVNYEPGSFLMYDDKKFELKQFHLHTPSENLIKGVSYPMEAHFVHVSDDADKEITVLAVMFEYGDTNPFLAELIRQLPTKVGEIKKLEKKLDAAMLQPVAEAHDHYYRFNGSLTTPPCTEGVRWIVMAEPIEASKTQIEKFKAALPHANNRPVQPTRGRIILEN